MVTTDTEHTRPRNIKATFRGNHNTIVCQSEMVATYAEHTRSRNMKDTFRENNKNIVYFSCIGY